MLLASPASLRPQDGDSGLARYRPSEPHEHAPQGGFQRWKIVSHGGQQHAKLEPVVVVPQHVADPGDPLPRNARLAGFKLSGSCHEASEMISKPRSTARLRIQSRARVSAVSLLTASRTPSMAAIMSSMGTE
jgi:hypothetical protein